eukprot:CAMPEP_0202733548 /NCGR_PEP_ID=MMETSP1385-20130828/188225_1 /ASSEMBLY_ACC=CAM_ASM_000861 /TAXON_ID=933848 /ORGANISM="Elphidium margaritaceum" /LENGTH=35 /DNA_ID= /DNA_START= /DNA_END= /DNA_ORIENTATION=
MRGEYSDIEYHEKRLSLNDVADAFEESMQKVNMYM